MKHSKLKIFFAVFIGFALGALCACIVYFATVGKVSWEQYIKEEIIPNAVLALTTIVTFCVAATPIVNKVTSALGLFNKATDDINKTAKDGDENQKSIAELKDEIKKDFVAAAENIKTEFKEGKEAIERIDKTTQNTETIARIGFCNTDELVKKGYAAEIAKVGVEDECEKVEE